MRRTRIFLRRWMLAGLGDLVVKGSLSGCMPELSSTVDTCDSVVYSERPSFQLWVNNPDEAALRYKESQRTNVIYAVGREASRSDPQTSSRP